MQDVLQHELHVKTANLLIIRKSVQQSHKAVDTGILIAGCPTLSIFGAAACD